MMNRRQLLRAFASMGILAEFPAISLHAAENEKPVPQGLVQASGKVFINGKEAKRGQAVLPDDHIVTGRGAEAVYVVGSDAYLQRGDSSVALIGDNVQRGLRVLSGKLLSVFGRGEKNLYTTTATIGIRGTACYIEASKESVYFCLCYGKAEIASIVDPKIGETIQTHHHDHPVILSGNPERFMRPARGVINHRDAELVLLESLVGRIPPFVGQPDAEAY